MTTDQTPALQVEKLRERIAEVVAEDGGCWRACSGCQEGEDGYVSAKDYPYSAIFQCQPGGGCHECGGIGVLWEDGAFLASYGAALSPSAPSLAEGVEIPADVSICNALIALGFCVTTGEAERLIRGGGAYLNGEKVASPLVTVRPGDEVRAGKKHCAIYTPTSTAPASGEDAVEIAIKAMGWTDERMATDARKLASGYAFAGFGVGGECFLTSAQVGHFNSVLVGVRAALASTPTVSADLEQREVDRLTEVVLHEARENGAVTPVDAGDAEQIVRAILAALPPVQIGDGHD